MGAGPREAWVAPLDPHRQIFKHTLALNAASLSPAVGVAVGLTPEGLFRAQKGPQREGLKVLFRVAGALRGPLGGPF